MQNSPIDNFWQFEASYWLHQLGSSVEGLTTTDAEKKLKDSGNALPKNVRWKNTLLLFFGQFKNSIMV